MTFRLPTLLCLAALLAAPSAGADTYRFDPVHSRIVFRIDHAGLSQAMGAFSGATGQLVFDEDDWAGARVDVRVPLASLEIGDAEWRTRVLSRTFLDGGAHPDAHFVSTTVEPAGDGRARVTGDLTLRGTTVPVVLDVRLNAVKRHPVTLRRSAGFSATATLRRADFGITAWPNVIGAEATLMIEVEAMRDAADAPSPPDRQEPTDAAAEKHD